MGIQNWSEDTIFVGLHREPQMQNQLKTVTDIIRDRGDCNVIVDFSEVDIITSSSLSVLLKLRKLLTDSKHRLVFRNISTFTRSAFKITGLDGIFEPVDDDNDLYANLKSLNKDELGSKKTHS